MNSITSHNKTVLNNGKKSRRTKKVVKLKK